MDLLRGAYLCTYMQLTLPNTICNTGKEASKTCIYICIRCMYVYINMYMYTLFVYTYRYRSIYVSIYRYTSIYVSLYVSDVCMYICTMYV